jgi:hypothetical protein
VDEDVSQIRTAYRLLARMIERRETAKMHAAAIPRATERTRPLGPLASVSFAFKGNARFAEPAGGRGEVEWNDDVDETVVEEVSAPGWARIDGAVV